MFIRAISKIIFAKFISKTWLICIFMIYQPMIDLSPRKQDEMIDSMVEASKQEEDADRNIFD